MGKWNRVEGYRWEEYRWGWTCHSPAGNVIDEATGHSVRGLDRIILIHEQERREYLENLSRATDS